MREKPQLSTLGNKELDKAEAQFQKFDEQVKEMTHDRMRAGTAEEREQQTKMSTREAQSYDAQVLTPARSIDDRQKFNEKFQADYDYKMELVKFIAENNEIIGETIELWTHPFGGKPAEFWKVPCNKPVYGPRHLATQIAASRYSRLIMQDTVRNSDGMGQYFGTMAVDTVKQRLNAHPVSDRKTTFMSSAF
jgi:hypothetical protein